MVVVGSAKTAGVFHLRSPSGKYKMNFSEADTACNNEGAALASFKQLGYAQQVFPSVKNIETNDNTETVSKLKSWHRALIVDYDCK